MISILNTDLLRRRATSSKGMTEKYDKQKNVIKSNINGYVLS